jgi:hypothetical protein
MPIWRAGGAEALQGSSELYDLLLNASAETMLTIAADPKPLGTRIGVT